MVRLVSIVLSTLLLYPAVGSAEPPPEEKRDERAAKEPRRGWFGIGLEGATAEQMKEIGVDRAVPRVTRIFKGSPAQTSDVHVGDYVLVFDGEPVQGTQDLVNRVGAKAPGSHVVFELHRPGEGRIKKNVVLDLRVDMRELFKKEWLGRKMPNVAIAGARPADGQRIDLSPKATSGKIVVIDYFATWCGPCKAVMPELEALQRKYAEHEVEVIGVSGEEMDVVRPFTEERKLAYKVGVDTNGDFRSELIVSVLPTVWVIDREGVIRDIFFGAGHGEKIEATVRSAAGLGQAGATPSR